MRAWHYLILIVLFSLPVIAVGGFFSLAVFTSHVSNDSIPFAVISALTYSYGIAFVTIPILLARLYDMVKQGKLQKDGIVIFSAWYGIGVLLVPVIMLVL